MTISKSSAIPSYRRGADYSTYRRTLANILMRTLASIITIMTISANLFGTNQVKDILIYNNDTLYFYNSPLDFLSGLTESYTAKELFGDDFFGISSHCWRGFKAEWRILDSCLYLCNVYDCQKGVNLNIIVEKLLNKKFVNGLMRADWVNNSYWCGKDIVGGLFISIYKHEYFFKFDAGYVKELQIFHYQPCEYETEEDLLHYIFNQIDWDNAPSILDKNYHISVYLEPNEFGGVGDVIFESSYNDYVPVLWKILWNLPCLNVYYRKNEFYDVGESIYIDINSENKAKYVR